MWHLGGVRTRLLSSRCISLAISISRFILRIAMTRVVARDDAYGLLSQPNASGTYELTDDYVHKATEDVDLQLRKADKILGAQQEKNAK